MDPVMTSCSSKEILYHVTIAYPERMSVSKPVCRRSERIRSGTNDDLVSPPLFPSTVRVAWQPQHNRAMGRSFAEGLYIDRDHPFTSMSLEWKVESGPEVNKFADSLAWSA
jgi:hypothetical protein